MNERTMEDLLLGLFDPLMTDVERLSIHQDHTVISARSLDEAEGGGVDAPAGIELIFADDTTIWLIIAEM